jgi:hypothetical protein
MFLLNISVSCNRTAVSCTFNTNASFYRNAIIFIPDYTISHPTSHKAVTYLITPWGHQNSNLFHAQLVTNLEPAFKSCSVTSCAVFVYMWHHVLCLYTCDIMCCVCVLVTSCDVFVYMYTCDIMCCVCVHVYMWHHVLCLCTCDIMWCVCVHVYMWHHVLCLCTCIHVTSCAVYLYMWHHVLCICTCDIMCCVCVDGYMCTKHRPKLSSSSSRYITDT